MHTYVPSVGPMSYEWHTKIEQRDPQISTATQHSHSFNHHAVGFEFDKRARTVERHSSHMGNSEREKNQRH